MPATWEDRTCLYCGFLIEAGCQSSTIKSYISAIKAMLKKVGHKWRDDLAELSSLTKRCEIANDQLKTRLPIQKALLDQILFEVERKFITTRNQPYLAILYKTAFLMAYYGLFRAGEITKGVHVIKAKDVHECTRKNKYKIYLWTSKTHNTKSAPQVVEIGDEYLSENIGYNRNREVKMFAPVGAIRSYIQRRRGYASDQEQFLIYNDGSPLTSNKLRRILRNCLEKIRLTTRII